MGALGDGDEVVRAHVYISGRVQGVFFRATTREQADRQAVAGWVRNLPDGRVEAVFEGPRGAVEECLAWCRQGPPGARVAGVEVEWEPPRGEQGFRVR
jgi:acylphosphatase